MAFELGTQNGSSACNFLFVFKKLLSKLEAIIVPVEGLEIQDHVHGTLIGEKCLLLSQFLEVACN